MKKILITALIIIIIAAALSITNEGLKRHERAECTQWQQQADEYPRFFMAAWQLNQCETLNIPITFKN